MKNADILFHNSHWEGKDIPRSPYAVKRKAFGQAREMLKSRMILIICGLRRVGKSVLSRQLLEEAAQQLAITSPRSILIYSFENEDLQDLMPSSALNELLDAYFRNILKVHPQKVSTPTLILLDEVQNIENWQSVVKKYYDLNANLKFIITGSSSLFLSESAESLAGRAVEIELPCLDFQEFLSFVGSRLTIEVACKDEQLRAPVPVFVTEEHRELFDNFLLCGAFPDTALMFRDGISIKECQKFIRDGIINKVLLRDLKRYYRVQNTNFDVKLFEICCRETGCFIELVNLASEVGLSAVSIKRHLDIFQQTGLVSAVFKYDRKLRRQIRSTPKIYVASPAIAFSMLREDSTKDSATTGHMVESYALQRLKTLNDKIYIDLTHGQTEVDFYLPSLKYLIECKYAKRVEPRMFGYLKDRAIKTNCSTLIVTKEHWDSGQLEMLPAMFL